MTRGKFYFSIHYVLEDIYRNVYHREELLCLEEYEDVWSIVNDRFLKYGYIKDVRIISKSKKKAEEYIEHMNNSYINNGTYIQNKEFFIMKGAPGFLDEIYDISCNICFAPHLEDAEE